MSDSHFEETKLPWMCSTAGCHNPKEGRTDHCSSCNKAQRKQERIDNAPVKPLTGLRRGSPPNKQSDKRAGENERYSKLRDKFLKDNPICQCCGSTPADCVHHKKGRQNSLLCEVQYFMAVCNSCHDAIHADPNWSFENGYMLLRSKQEIIDNSEGHNLELGISKPRNSTI